MFLGTDEPQQRQIYWTGRQRDIDAMVRYSLLQLSHAILVQLIIHTIYLR